MALGATAGTLLSRNTAEAHGQLHVDSATTDPAIHGNNTNPTDDAGEGVLGTSVNGPGVRGVSTNDVGVRGRCDNGAGVNGNNDGVGAGVVGRARNGAGVRGIAPGENPGVLAQSGLQRPNQLRVLDNALALLALGHTLFRPATAADGTLVGSAFSGPTLEVIGFARLGSPCRSGRGRFQPRRRFIR